MTEFPHTQIEGLSLPRLIAGTNWFLGFSHTSAAKDKLIRETITRERLADILEVFLRAGSDAIYGGGPGCDDIDNAIKDAEGRVGRKIHRITIPSLNIDDGQDALDETARILDDNAAWGTELLMPHQCTTDALVCRRTHSLPGMEVYAAMIRDRGMIPGLSTHTPEVPVYADESGLDVATYVQMYNAAGFLMQVEVDWVHRTIWNCKKPVITIKPLAAGRLLPLVGLAFVWATLREQDMVTVGTLTADEAREVVDISLSLLSNRGSDVELQETRSKQSIVGK